MMDTPERYGVGVSRDPGLNAVAGGRYGELGAHSFFRRFLTTMSYLSDPTSAAVVLSKAQIRENAIVFAKRWANARSESSERQLFWNELFQVFGVDLKVRARFEEAATTATGGLGWMDLFWPGEMAVEHKSAGEDLDKASDQLNKYLPGLGNSMPWLAIVCDFQQFRWNDSRTETSGQFTLAELPDNLDIFYWMANHNRPGETYENDEDANLKATALLADVHDAVLATNYDEHHLRQWITRILFCLFADDTGVWPRALLHTYLYNNTALDGHDLGSVLHQIFEILNTPEDNRPNTLGVDLSEFTYINGDLFEENLPTVFATTEIREALLDACAFNWAAISPAIFGSLFQNVMTPKERRHLGAHYTTEDNILRVIHPLFLDQLEAELESAKSKTKLEAFHQKIADLTFFDPACGCGNFLVVTYRELRRLETECLRKLGAKDKNAQGQLALDLKLRCRVNVEQFYGIEIEEFPALIARTALYLADHLANREISAEFGQVFARFPIPTSPHIHIANALRINWNDVLPADQCDYLYGNPPFSGHALAGKDPVMKEDKALAFSHVTGHDKRIGRLDYVAAWYAAAVPYLDAGQGVAAFVSTNSITQGEQARTMGPFLKNNGFEIVFAHRTFAWTSEARGKAHVHVVIIGFAPTGRRSGARHLYEYDDLQGDPEIDEHRQLTWYLTPGAACYPNKHTQPIAPGVPSAPSKGSQPTDGGFLLVTPGEYDEVESDSVAAQYLHPYMQSVEFLQGKKRWCLWLVEATPTELNNSAVLHQRLSKVREARLKSPTKSVREAADTPAIFTQRRQPTTEYLAIPEVSSASRDYIPGAFLSPEVIAGNKLLTLPSAPMWIFGILQSSMWMAWVRTVVGRLKSDYSIAPDLAYNAFPFPEPAENGRRRIETAAEGILSARKEHPDASLADLYGPLSMPTTLVAAHRKLDNAVDASYGRHKHTGDASRLKVLFARYAKLTGGDTSLFEDD